MTLIEIFRRKKWINQENFIEIEKQAKEIASMIKGLINAISK